MSASSYISNAVRPRRKSPRYRNPLGRRAILALKRGALDELFQMGHVKSEFVRSPTKFAYLYVCPRCLSSGAVYVYEWRHFHEGPAFRRRCKDALIARLSSLFP